MNRKFLPFLAFSVFLGAAAPLGAEIRFELGFGWTMVKPAMNATYVNQFQPPLTPSDPYYIASSADQTVHFKGKTAYGLNGFFNLLFTENLGLQILADYHRPGVGGANDPYVISIQYLAPTPQTYSRSIDWNDSSGHINETAFSLNALGRFRVADNLSLSVSAGPSVFHFEGQAGHIGYTFFNLAVDGTEYTLTGQTFRMVVEFGPRTRYGLNAGIEAAYEAARNVILAVDLRWFGAARTDFKMRIREDELITVPISEIEERIGLGSLSINPSYLRAGLALRFIF